MKIILSLILFTYSFNLISQERKSVETSFSVKEERAIFKGCENLGTPSAKEKCTQEKINEFIGNNIDAKIAIKQGIKGKHRVRVILKIDKFGKVSEIISNSENKKVNKSIKKAFKKFPQMIPYMSRDRPTSTSITIPITLMGLE